jgi:hypothetical protein
MKKLIASLGLAAAALCGVTPASAAIVVSFDPAAMTVGNSASFSVDVNISGLASDFVSGYGLHLLYDASLLTYVGVAFNTDQLGGGLSWGTGAVALDTPAPGNIDLFATSFSSEADLDSNQLNSFTLMTLSFMSDASKTGSSLLRFGPSPDYDRNIVGAADANGEAQSLDVQFGQACINVDPTGGNGRCATVPEPSSYALLAMAFMGAYAPVAMRRRRKGL